MWFGDRILGRFWKGSVLAIACNRDLELWNALERFGIISTFGPFFVFHGTKGASGDETRVLMLTSRAGCLEEAAMSPHSISSD